MALAGKLSPVSIHLTDLNLSLRYSLFDGIVWTDTPESACEIALASPLFAMLLQHGYGYGTVDISGRFRELRPSGRPMLSRNFVPQRYNEMGYFFPSSFFSPSFLLERLRAL